MGQSELRMGPIEWGLLLLLSIIWGGSFLLGKITVHELPPVTVAWLRVALAAASLALVLGATGGRFPRGITGWAPFLIMGLVNNALPFSLIFLGQHLGVGAGLASVLNATTPMFGGILGHLLTAEEKLRANRLAGVLIGIGGVVVLVGPSVLTGLGANLEGQLAVLAAAACYGLASVYARRFRGTPPLASACCQLVCSTLILTPVACILDRPWQVPMPSLQIVLALVVLALVCTSLAYVIFFTIIARAGSMNVMLVTLLVPLSAVVLAALLLGERLTAGQLLGGGIILLALVVIDGRALAALRHMRLAF